MKEGVKVPTVVFKTRVRDESIGGDNPFRWQDMATNDYFGGKRVVVFSLPGAFTPTCSTFQVPGLKTITTPSRLWAWMKFTVCLSTMHL